MSTSKRARPSVGAEGSYPPITEGLDLAPLEAGPLFPAGVGSPPVADSLSPRPTMPAFALQDIVAPSPIPAAAPPFDSHMLPLAPTYPMGAPPPMPPMYAPAPVLPVVPAAPPQPPQPIPSPNFTGSWILDADRSDSLEEYLKAHGLPLIARQAAEKLELTQQIHQTESAFRITRRSKISCDVKDLTFNHETSFKTARITISREPFAVLTVSVLPGDKGTLTDRRTLEDGGQTMRVVLDLRLNKDGGVKQVITNRIFRRHAQGAPGAVGSVRRRDD